MNRDWIYLKNPFLSATEDSYRAMQKIGNFTLNALRAFIQEPSSTASKKLKQKAADNDVAFYNNLFQLLEPLVLDFRTKYAAFGNQQGVQKGQTSTLANSLAILSADKIVGWDLIIQNAYRVGTPQYEKLMPNRRRPFQRGKQQERVKAVESLRMGVSADPSMPESLKTDISNFLEELKTNYNNKDTQKSKTMDVSWQVEEARKELAYGLYEVLGHLIIRFSRNPERAAIFFDEETIRSKMQTTFRHKVKAGSTVDVLTHTFEPDEKLRIENDGVTDLLFYLAAQKSDEPGSTVVIVNAQKQEVVTPAQLGNPASRYLKAANMHPMQDGHYKVSLI